MVKWYHSWFGTKERRFDSFYRDHQVGTCWVTDGVKPIKIKKEDLGAYLGNGYAQGRKYSG